MATPLSHSHRVPVGRRHRTLLAWAAALTLHLIAIGTIAEWRLAPAPVDEPVSLDVILTTRSGVEPGAAQAIAEASQRAMRREAVSEAAEMAQLEAPSAPAPPPTAPEPSEPAEAPAPQSPPAPEPTPAPEPAPAPQTPEEPEPAPAPEPAPEPVPPPRPEAPSSPSGAASAPSGQALLAQATTSVRQRDFAAPERAVDSGDRDQRAARRAAEARYIDAWTRRVEAYGNRHYPAPDALDGQLRIRVVIGRDGQLRQAEVIQSSGHPELDQAALKTVHGAAPYRPFDSGMVGMDSLAITRTWRFGKGNNFGVR